MGCLGMTGRYQVLSVYVGNEEGTTEPFLEAVFRDEKDAHLYAQSWNDIQPNQQFWVTSR